MRYMSLSFSPKMAATAILNSEKWRISTLGKVQKYYFNLRTKFWLDTKPIPRYCLLTKIQDGSLRNVEFQRYQWRASGVLCLCTELGSSISSAFLGRIRRTLDHPRRLFGDSYSVTKFRGGPICRFENIAILNFHFDFILKIFINALLGIWGSDPLNRK